MIHKDDGNLHALAQYQAQQDKLELTRRELEAAQVRALVETLERRKATTPSMYTGVDLIREALSEHAGTAYLPMARFFAYHLDGNDYCLEDAAAHIDTAALGRLTLALIWPYLTDYAERNAEDYLPSVDGPERED